MSWVPGLPVRTVQDHAEWREWCRERKRQAQRDRRTRYRRIDYYPSDEAGEVIDAHVRPSVGCDYSSVINRIICEWSASLATE